LWVHFWMRGENVEAAHGVPRLPVRRRLAQQQHLLPGKRMLVVRARQARHSICAGIVGAFALPHRVERQHHVP